MPQEDNGTCEVKHAEKVVKAMFPAHCEATEVLKPSEEPFDLPTSAVAT